MFLSETIGLRATKFGMQLCLMGLCQVSSKYGPGVKFDPTPGSTSFTWDYIGKTLGFSLYVAMRHRVTKYCMQLYLLSLYQECPNYSPWVKFGLIPGVTSFTMAYTGKTCQSSLYLAIRPRLTKFCMQAYLVGFQQECPNYSPWVKFGHKLESQVLLELIYRKLQKFPCTKPESLGLPNFACSFIQWAFTKRCKLQPQGRIDCQGSKVLHGFMLRNLSKSSCY